MSNAAATISKTQALMSRARMMGAEAVGCRMICFSCGTQLATPGFNTDLSTYRPDCATLASNKIVDGREHPASNLFGQ
jgi:hypothetical protein